MSGRVGTLDNIQSRVTDILNKIPVTRVTDVSRLDRSDVPVFAAVTPLAKDLTTHMGKGLSHQAARVSATMEAVERISAEQVRGTVIRSSLSKLKNAHENCVDPLQFDLPPTTAYRPDQPIDWVEGWDLIRRCAVQVPVDLCISPPREGVLDQVDTNGLASGASYGEAIRHALLEVIERDAISQHEYFDLYGDADHTPPPARRLDNSTVPAKCRDLMQRVLPTGGDITLENLASDIGVAVIGCTLTDPAYPTDAGPRLRRFGGWGADTSPQTALDRAITEAHQSRIGTIQGARDWFNLTPKAIRQFTRSRHQDKICNGRELAFSSVPDFTTPDLCKDVENLLARLVSIGVAQVIVVDMTRTELAIPVVRVRIPGLAVFTVDRRRTGWRCARHIL